MENAVKQNKRTGIVLNRMYVGDYLSNNIGHEVINLFKADNGKHYIYLNSRGNLAKEHNGKISTMLFVKYHTKGEVEVIGKAVGLLEADGVFVSLSRSLDEVNTELSNLQKEYIKKQKDGVYYNGASILDIFKGAGQQNIYITYQAKSVYRVKKEKKVFVRFSNAGYKDIPHKESDKLIVLENYKQAKASLKQYVYPNSDNQDYEQLMSIVNDSTIWEEKTVQKLQEEISDLEKKLNLNRDVSLFDICKIQNDENRLSNASAYFMTEYPKLWNDFFKKGKCHKYNGETLGEDENIDITLGTTWRVEREYETKNEDGKLSSGRIDLFITNDKNIIIIENKIKSDINVAAADNDDKNQLNRYINYVDWFIKNKCEKEPNSHFFILTPNYNIPQISDEMKTKYKVITYRNLCDFLKDRTEVEKDPNFKSFLEAIRRHAYDNVKDYLYNDMMEKLARRINEVCKNKIKGRCRKS